ncbi:gp53-like domain-containing protein [Paenibacillus senegalensis]|uniref:gp53-like domain-containing protein n=1 Tax=Paenibacillus senegalensis TaxID=1465766 RepID=UPI00028870E0|nr:hypothetical protein [Paenibacillus senegalensis]
MAQLPMYPAIANSPQTELAEAIDATQTTITVVDPSVLPDGPNLVTINPADETAETIRYAAIDGNQITGCERGFQGMAQSWQAGTKARRGYTAYDHDTFRHNIDFLQNGLTQTAIDLVNHTLDNDNPHGVTPEQIGAETPTGAQDKANQAEANAKAASLPITGGEMSGNIVFDSDSSGIRGLDTTSRQIITGGPNASAASGGRIAIEGMDFGGSGAGGNIRIIPGSGKDVFIGNNAAWHGGNNPSGGVSNGYQVFASGKIMQYGGGNYSNGDTVTFPIAFPGNVRAVVCSTSGSQSLAVQAGVYTPTSFVVNFDGGSRNIRYIAFGD